MFNSSVHGIMFVEEVRVIKSKPDEYPLHTITLSMRNRDNTLVEFTMFFDSEEIIEDVVKTISQGLVNEGS